MFDWLRRRRNAHRQETACVICGEWRNTVPIPMTPPRGGLVGLIFDGYPPPDSPYFCGEEHMAEYFTQVIAAKEREFG